MFLANFSTTNAAKPSFFEMVAQQQMMPTLKPALKYLLTVIAQRNPQVEWLITYNDEIFFVALLMLEKHYLQHYDASFSENFYSLKRVLAGPLPATLPSPPTSGPSAILSRLIQAETQLRPRHKFGSLFFLVVVPYLKGKLDALHKRLAIPSSPFGAMEMSEEQQIAQAENESLAAGGARAGRLQTFLKTIFLKVYPWMNAAYEGSFFLYQLLYLYDHTRYFTPFLHLEGQEVVRLSFEEALSQEQSMEFRRASAIHAIRGTGLGPRLRRLLLRILHIVFDYSKYVLPLAIFFFKFLEWWYAENRGPAQSLPTPPPPEPPKRAPDGIELPADRSVCGLCNEQRTNPGMVASSGYVFCYPCIFNYVKQHQRCPVTHLPATLDQVRKIYEAR